MFVGDTGIARVIRRSLVVMKELGTDDPAKIRAHGAIDLPTVQRYINFWFSSSLDLFGSESSSNAASYFASGIKGRPDETNYEDHLALNQTFTLERPDGNGGITTEEVPLRNAMNEVTRAAYVKDCEIGLTRWNRTIQKAGYDVKLSLPSTRFRRNIGTWAGITTDPQGKLITASEFEAKKDGWLPSDSDRTYVKSLMKAVTEPGKMASWVAPPDRGINNNPVEYEYVKLH
jgi:benzoyl-CoA 2,3-dioxygenase component B